MSLSIEYYISKLLKKLRFKAVKNSIIDKSSRVGSGTLFIDSTMGRNSFCGYDCTISSANIGSFCSIASNCEIGGASHSLEWVSTSPVFNENRDQIKQKYSFHKFDTTMITTIGHDVWLGANVLVKSGVEIGTGSVIGMGSVVTKNIPPYEIWAGNPAKFIKRRFDIETSERLLNSRWWELSDSELRDKAINICDVAAFLNSFKRGK